ncbi:MAG: DUF1456 family protein [Bacteroidota bacterium]
MNNNDVFKKLRVALKLRDDDIISILELADFKISKSELGAFFRKEDHPKYMECGDQILRNFLNGLILYLRGTKEKPTHPGEVLLRKKNLPPKNTASPKRYAHRGNPDISHVKYKNKPARPDNKKKS